MNFSAEIAEVFGNVRIFAGMDRDSLAMLSEAATPVPFQPGTTLVHKDSPGNTIFLLASGRVEVFDKDEVGNEIHFAYLGPMDYFGEMAIIECRPRSAWVRASEAGVAVTLRSTDMLHLYEKLPAQYAVLILNIARDLSRRISELDRVFSARAGHIDHHPGGLPGA